MEHSSHTEHSKRMASFKTDDNSKQMGIFSRFLVVSIKAQIGNSAHISATPSISISRQSSRSMPDSMMLSTVPAITLCSRDEKATSREVSTTSDLQGNPGRHSESKENKRYLLAGREAEQRSPKLRLKRGCKRRAIIFVYFVVLNRQQRW